MGSLELEQQQEVEAALAGNWLGTGGVWDGLRSERSIGDRSDLQCGGQAAHGLGSARMPEAFGGC